MAIPKHDEIRIPALTLLKSGDALRLKDFIEPLALHFKLTESEVNEIYPSGNGHVFYDRISWSLSYLFMSQLITRPSRGVYQISDIGLKMLANPNDINNYIEKTIDNRDSAKAKKQSASDELIIIPNTEDLTPQEKLEVSFENIRTSIYAEILATILSKRPYEFEKLVVQLLQKLGYGGEIKNSGLVTKASNDGGIDGIIKEDVLGFGRIYIQAKRYKLDTGIGREEIQKFVGALAVAQSNKGVFITTSYFTKGALEYVESLNGSTTVVLIDGKQLAEHIYDCGLGLQTEYIIEVKKFDFDFWDSMNDDTEQHAV